MVFFLEQALILLNISKPKNITLLTQSYDFLRWDKFTIFLINFYKLRTVVNIKKISNIQKLLFKLNDLGEFFIFLKIINYIIIISKH